MEEDVVAVAGESLQNVFVTAGTERSIVPFNPDNFSKYANGIFVEVCGDRGEYYEVSKYFYIVKS